jgi:hypothetical protein
MRFPRYLKVEIIIFRYKESAYMNYNNFHPPFCPNQRCRFHDPSRIRSNPIPRGRNRRWYYKCGVRTISGGREIQMFKCKECKTGFSTRTFSVDYWEKRHLSYPRLLSMLTGCMGIRAMGRSFGCSPRTVENKIGRLSRQAVGVTVTLKPRLDLVEELVADGFESFNGSQYFPDNYNILVGKRSQFLYFINYSHLRRKGRMTDDQKEEAEKLKKDVIIPPFQIRYRFAELADEAVRLLRCSSGKKQLTLHTDKKIEYKQVLSSLELAGADPSEGYRLFHIRISSRAFRGPLNPLFSVNYMDREFRKDLAEHVRESTRFGRNVSNACERMEIYRVQHNCIKKYRINRSGRLWDTHAEAAGLGAEEVKRVLSKWLTRRCFYSHLELDLHMGKVWGHGYATAGKLSMDYVPAFIYM